MARRARAQIDADRAAIVAALPAPDELLVTHRDLAQRLNLHVDDLRQADLAALVNAGLVEREVRQEWDHVYQPHFGNGMTNAVRRNRAYYRRAA
jgi:hypothetical protein